MVQTAFCLLCALFTCGNSFAFYDIDAGERFPLSGGLRDGMHVDITFNRYWQKDTKIDFLAPSGITVFQLDMYTHPGDGLIHVVRSNGNAIEVKDLESWGEMPLDNTTSHTFSFLMGGNGVFVVSIDGVRTPWIDYKASTAQPITHVFVHRGFTYPRVTMSRPSCTTPCAVQECTDPWGKSLCHDDKNTSLPASNCTAVFKGTRCTQSPHSRPEGTVCCQGTPRTLHVVDPWFPYTSWLQIVDDKARINASCKAFNLTSCSFEAMDVYKYERMVFRGDNSEQHTGLVQCWNRKLDESVQIPLTILAPVIVSAMNVTLDKANMRRVSFNYSTLMVDYTEEETAFLGYMYGALMHEKAGDNDSEPWVAIIQDRWFHWSQEGTGGNTHKGVSAVFTNVPMEYRNYTCTDNQPMGDDVPEFWEDPKGRNCSVYQSTPLCDYMGKPSKESGWEGWTGGENVKYDMYPPKACCACGGGYYGGNLSALPEDASHLNVGLHTISSRLMTMTV